MRTAPAVVGSARLLLACAALAEPTSNRPLVLAPHGQPGTKLGFLVRDFADASLSKDDTGPCSLELQSARNAKIS